MPIFGMMKGQLGETSCTPIELSNSILDGRISYLSVVTNRRHRIAMCRLRVSCHNLRIETGRYKRPQIPAEQRICLYCNSGMVDDEKHFITGCRITGLQRYFVQSCFKRQPCFSRIIRTREDVIYVHHHQHQRY